MLESIEQDYRSRIVPQDQPARSLPAKIPLELQPKTKADVRMLPSHEKILSSVSWPQNKPIADIVFPQTIRVNDEVSPALWVMLPQQEILKRSVCNRYNQFLFLPEPHPMLLWITVLYNRKHGVKWLPYYLDLKTNLGQEIVRLLAKTGYYRLLFFAREAPSRCSHILLCSIATAQCKNLKQWAEESQLSTASADSQTSKNVLKNEYEKIKPQILSKLEAIVTDSPLSLSG